MNINDTPKDKGDFKDKGELSKILFVTKEDGSYTTVGSEGWDVEGEATQKAWSAIENILKETKLAIQRGELSPIAYYKEKCLFGMGTLANYMGLWKWQVKRHMKPKGFQKMSQKTLEKYAVVFNIQIDDLLQFDSKSDD